MGESIPDGGILHAADPEPGKGLLAFALVIDEPENQLALPSGVGGADEAFHIRPGHEAAQDFKLLLGSGRHQVLPLFGQNGQVSPVPSGEARVIAAGRGQLHQMADTPADEVAACFQVAFPALYAAQGFPDGLGGRGLFGDDELGQKITLPSFCGAKLALCQKAQGCKSCRFISVRSSTPEQSDSPGPER